MQKNQILFDLLKEHKFDEFSNILKDDIKNEIDINIRDNSNNYLIQYAILYNKKELVSLLINKGIRLDVIDADGRCLLFYPIKYKYITILELLLHFNKVNIGVSLVDIKDREGYTSLHYTIMFDDLSSAELLLTHNADPNIKNKDGIDCLHLAVYKKNVEMVSLLIKKTIDINSYALNGETPLHYACNFQNYEICKILLENGADPNIQDFEHEISPIIYSISLRNIKIFNLLLSYGADINVQDYYGNTPLHYLIQEDDLEMFDHLMEKSPLVNLYNAESKIPLHLVLEKSSKNLNHYVKKLIKESDLNIQNNLGNSVLHLMIVTVWKDYVSELEKKQLNIFLKNMNEKTVLFYLQNIDQKQKISDYDIFIDVVVKSFLYQLKNEDKDSKWAIEWEQQCAKAEIETNDWKKCYEVTKKFIIDNSISIPIKKMQDIAVNFLDKTCIKFTTFTGIILDILIGVIYLMNKHSNTCSTLTENFEINEKLEKYYISLGLKTNHTTEFLNFEIIWIYQKLFFPSEFAQSIKECLDKGVRFIVIPLGIELHNGNHANYLIYDSEINEIERFEPTGSHNPYRFNYNPTLLDTMLERKLKEIIKDVIYVKPSDYLPKIGFQLLDTMESGRAKRIGDPGGFCAAWAMWYVDMRISNPGIPRKILVEGIIKKIKQYNHSFKNIIRNYTNNIIEIRDKILSKGNIDINEWINEQFTYDQGNAISKEIKGIISYLKGTTKNKPEIFVKKKRWVYQELVLI